MKRLVPALAVLLLTTPAAAQDYDEDQLAKVEAIHVNVLDSVSVSDGCLPQPNALRIEAELILRRSGIEVVELRELVERHVLSDIRNVTPKIERRPMRAAVHY